jgi:DNA-binding CsgD family transcriptional regulator
MIVDLCVHLSRKEKRGSGNIRMTRFRQRDSQAQGPGEGGRSLAVAAPGFLLVDADLSPIYVNDEAVSILTYASSLARTRSTNQLLHQRVQSALAEARASNPSHVARIESGRRHYLCRFFSISRSGPSNHKPALALLLERSAAIGFLQKAAEFHFTRREREAVHLLAHGLTSKEIARRMGISPNTAKVFLRLAMAKTRVSTRSGLIARFLREA